MGDAPWVAQFSDGQAVVCPSREVAEAATAGFPGAKVFACVPTPVPQEGDGLPPDDVLRRARAAASLARQHFWNHGPDEGDTRTAEDMADDAAAIIGWASRAALAASQGGGGLAEDARRDLAVAVCDALWAENGTADPADEGAADEEYERWCDRALAVAAAPAGPGGGLDREALRAATVAWMRQEHRTGWTTDAKAAEARADSLLAALAPLLTGEA